MNAQIEVVADGLAHPQAPDILPSGEVLFVETYTGRLTAWGPENGLRTFADVGGCPNAVSVGSDGYVYFCQNGWTVGNWWAPKPMQPGVGRVKPDGSDPEMIFYTPDPIGLGACHDMTWGADGRLYVTDSGRFRFDAPIEHVGYIYALAPDGTTERLIACEYGYPCGIAAERDGGIAWVEAASRKLRRRRPDGTLETLATFDEGEAPEGMKIDAEGNYWIPFIGAEGVVRVVSPAGEVLDELFSEGRLLNCVFGDEGLYIIDFGLQRVHPNTGGSLKLAHVDVKGQPLFRGAIDAGVTGVRA